MKFILIRQVKNAVLFGAMLFVMAQWFSCRPASRAEGAIEIPEGDVQ
jgi:hypothetical protein